MAVTSCREKPDGRGGAFSADGSGDATRVFEVMTDSAADDGFSVVQGAALYGLPLLYDFHPRSILHRVAKITPRQKDGTTRFWLVTVEYSKKAPQEDKHPDNPLDEPVQRTWSTEAAMVPLIERLDGSGAILNAAGIGFDPPIEVRRARVKLQFVRNEATFSGAAALDYVDTVNQVAYSGAPRGTLYCDSITATEQFKNEVAYWQVTYVFLFDRRGWQPRPLEQGYHQLVGGELKRITDGNGEPVTEPVPLDEEGSRIPATELPAAAVFLEVDGYEYRDFHSLGLPS